jgi:hypothetical protein
LIVFKSEWVSECSVDFGEDVGTVDAVEVDDLGGF